MPGNPASLIPSLQAGCSGTIRAPASSDLSVLAVGDHLSFVSVLFGFRCDEPAARLKSWGRTEGVVLAVGFRSGEVLNLL